MADEIELKLDLTPEAADALEATTMLPGDPGIAEQRSVYFDTLDHQLSKTGLSLRIRRSGSKRLQTIKADGASAAGLFVRSEWERPVSNDTPVLDDTTPIRAVLGDAADAIRSEEHTSELQSLMRISYAVFCLKKKNYTKKITHTTNTMTTQK